SERHHPDDKEQHDGQHDAAAPHDKPDYSEIGARFVRNPRRLDAAGGAHDRVSLDGRVAQAACHHRGLVLHFTKTHSGLSNGKAITPMLAVAATSTALPTFHPDSTTRLPMA